MTNQLLERQKIEEKYHDEKCKHDHSAKKYKKNEPQYYSYFWELVNGVSGLKALDFGCGDGWASVRLARAGAKKIWGIDISGELIDKGNQWIKDKGLSSNIKLEKMAGENLNFPDNFFDLVLGSAVLHHTQLDLAIKNIFRVLKPGGRAIFIEPLNQNVFLRIWRRFTPWRRSPTEKALTKKDLKFIQDIFSKARYNFFGFTSILSEGLLIFSPGNKLFIIINTLLERIDHYLLILFPYLGKYSAVVVMELRKDS